MRRLSILLGCLAAVVFGLALQAAPQAETEEAPEIQQEPLTWKQASMSGGEELFAELCAVCHGTDAKGNGPAGPALKAPAPDLTQLALHNGGEFPFEEVRRTITGQTEVIAHGTIEMPVWGKAFADTRPDAKAFRREGMARLKIYDLTSYIESLQVAE